MAVKLKKSLTAGHTLVVVVGWNDVTSTITSVADTLGNAYGIAAPIVRSDVGVNSQVIYYSPNARAGTDTVTVKLSAKVQYPDLRVMEYAGVLAIDGSASASGSTTPSSAGPFATTAVSDLAIAAGTTLGAFVGEGAGYKTRVITSPNEDLVEDAVLGAPGGYTATAQNDGSPWVFQVAAFRTGFVVDAGTDAAGDAAADASGDGAADARGDAGGEGGVSGPADTGPDVAIDSGADATGADLDATSDAGAPTLVQHVSSSVNPPGRITGNAYRFTPPNPVLAGNCLIMGLSYGYSANRTVAISDSTGNAWPTSPAVTKTDGENLTSSIYVLPAAKPGATTITVTFDAALLPFQYTLSEFAGIAGASPVSGSASSMGLGPNLSTGLFTPGSSAAGNLVWSYFVDTDEGGDSHAAAHMTAGAGFALLDADIAWSDQGIPHGAAYEVQPTSAPVNPSMTVTQATADHFLSLAVSLRAANAGTLPGSGIRIMRIDHATNVAPPSPTWVVQLPSSGNLLVLSSADWTTGLLPIDSITDSNGNAWKKSQFDLGSPQVWYAPNAVTSQDLVVTMHAGESGGPASLQLWDIAHASSAPFDVMSGITQTDDPTGANISAVPSLTPTVPNGLTIAVLGLGQGPSSGLAAGSPAGAVFDFVHYSGETDLDLMDNADGVAHVYTSTTSPESWNWVIANGSMDTSYFATAVHFIGAP